MDEFFRVDDLLNFPNNDHLFSNDHSDHHYHVDQVDHQVKNHYASSSSNNLLHSYNNSSFSSGNGGSNGAQSLGYDFTGQLCVPNDDVAELEWLSNFVYDSAFNDFNTTDLTGTLISQSHTSTIPSAGRSKRSRQRIWKASTSLISSAAAAAPPSSTKISNTESDSSSSANGVRRCTHCASEKTPQWRMGPMGPKTLCNACGVRYKSGRLVPEYRPAASPTFELARHSNSHRKVMELRRQKEVRTTTVNHGQGHVYRHSHDFEVR